ncbi:MAG: hypothetical protein WC784_05105 [Candidatus Shapirobacteria bacterium]|jgi:hypothetical protein
MIKNKAKKKVLGMFLLLVLFLVIMIVWDVVANNKIKNISKNSEVVSENPTEKVEQYEPKGWVKYNSKCSGLSEISIYYPNDWKVAKLGEGKITSGYEDTAEGKKQYDSQCSVEFGYPVTPNGGQDTYVKDLKATVLVDGEDLPISQDITNLDQYLAGFSNDKDVLAINDKKINGNDWKIVKFKTKFEIWVTSNNGKLYSVQFQDWSGTLNSKIAEEMVQRIQFK